MLKNDAEEKLRELYFEQESTQRVTYDGKGNATIHTTNHDGVLLSHKQIDLIANLVVERLKTLALIKEA